jgi:chromosomal replication initiator protein
MTNLQAVWQEFLSIVKEEAGSRVVETWLKVVYFHKWDSILNTAYLNAPNKFVLDWIEKNYLILIKTHLSRLLNVTNLTIKIETLEKFDIDDKKENKYILSPIILTENNKNNLLPVSIPISTSIKNNIIASNLRDDQFIPNPAYLFSTFVVGSSNALTHAAAIAVTEKRGLIYNPLFIYGSSGLGKTHLLHAIANKIISENNNIKILYQTADRFVNEFIQAIRFDKVQQFRERYKNVDILLIDDVQFICNKDQTQEAFFHIFNSLYDQQKQIVFTCDQYPRDMNGLTDRLKSRMEWGLITDLQIPPLETRIAILKKKAEAHKIILADELADYIASNISSNVRELEGNLIRIIAFSTLTHQPISFELIDSILIRSNKASKAKDPFISDILEPFLNKNGITIEELRSKDRNKDLVKIRHVAMYLTKKFSKKTLHEIALFFGRKDHSTVLHAIGKIEFEIKFDKELKEFLDLSIAQFKNFN